MPANGFSDRFGEKKVNRSSSAQSLYRSPDCYAAYEVLRARGAEFLTPPVDWGYEIRAFFRDLDGHLLEISQT